MARGRGGARGGGAGLLVVVAGPYLLARASHQLAVLLGLAAACILLFALSRATAGRSIVFAISVWIGALALLGDFHGREDERERAAQEASFAATDRARTEAAQRREAERLARDEARRATILTEEQAPLGDRIQRALGTLEQPADNYARSNAAVCYARDVLARAEGSPDELEQEIIVLRRLESRVSNRVLPELRRDAEQARGVMCRDGSASSCACLESHSGCCSHHGGVAGCDEAERVTIECGDAVVERFLESTGRIPYERSNEVRR